MRAFLHLATLRKRRFATLEEKLKVEAVRRCVGRSKACPEAERVEELRWPAGCRANRSTDYPRGTKENYQNVLRVKNTVRRENRPCNDIKAREGDVGESASRNRRKA